MNSNLRVAFILGDFSCDPAVLSRILGIEATGLWTAGDVNPKSKVPYRTSGWMLEAPAENGDDLESRTAWLLARLPTTLRSIEGAEPEVSAKLYCSVYTSGDRPTLFLSADSVRRLGELSAAVDVDLYVVPED